MKLKSKLIMSGVALAACAATLTSTTYAWYTSNAVVSATGINAATASSGDSSIFISHNGSAWSQSVTATMDGGTELQPLQLVGSDLKLPGTLKDAEYGSNGGSSNYLTFDLYFKTAKTSAPVDLYLKSFQIWNTTGVAGDQKSATLPTYDNLLNGTDATCITNTAANYTVDAIKALAMTINNVGVTVGTDVETNAEAHTTASVQPSTINGQTAYSLDNGFASLNSSGTIVTGALAGTGGATNAHTYWETVSSQTIHADKKAAGTTALTNSSGTLKLAQLPMNGAGVKITFRIYLNGADTDCFDACKGQTFSMTMDFTSTAATS